jgi:putative peptide zinc metalloprotease protein
MNLTEALDAALPELPKSIRDRSRPPRLDPDLVVREDVLDGEPTMCVMQRGRANFFRFPPVQWKLASLFDGQRSYDEIAALYTEQTGIHASAEDVRSFADNMEEADFWYKTPQEKNLAMSERLMAQRGRRAQRASKINLAHISFSAWDPDRYLTWLDRTAGRFIYSRWSVLAAVLLFCFEAVIFTSKWSVIGPDIPLYYNFARKSFYDIVEFWVLLFALGFIHETAHGLTCKHWGGEVHSMGLMLLYLTPCFFVDVTESWVSATMVQRLGTIIAGIWVEMTVCGLAMAVWLNTASGMWVHEFAYKVILLTGLAVIVLNLNPLMKLDGYYFLTEFIGIPDLKERSTAFVLGWFQNRVLRLPVEVPSIPRRRAPLFVIYALVSGAYGYLMLLLFIRFAYNVGANWLAEFAVIPAGVLAFVMFRSRLKSVGSVGAQLWARHFGEGLRLRPVTVLAAAVLAILFFVPLWRDREPAYFVVESSIPVTLHAAVTGRVDDVLVGEGESVRAGQPLLRMSSVHAAAMRTGAEAATSSASFQVFESELRGQSIGVAAAEREAAVQSTGLARDAQASLLIAAPVDGLVLTDDPAALAGQEVASGQPLITLAGNGPRMVRLYVPASELDRIQPGDEVALAPPGRFSLIRLKLAPMEGAAVTLPPGLIPHQDYKGIELPAFYSARMTLATADSGMPLGTGGHALIFGVRRSLAARMAAVISNLFHAHVW